jgi:hypothetical protein
MKSAQHPVTLRAKRRESIFSRIYRIAALMTALPEPVSYFQSESPAIYRDGPSRDLSRNVCAG